MESVINHDDDDDDNEKQYEDDPKQQHFHVLAVDDSLIDRKFLERLLTVSSYQVTSVDSGDKALEYLGLMGIEDNEYEESSSKQLSQQEVSKINLVMTDYSMPGITGYDLLKRIKDSSWKNIPVVVMSSENVPSRINMCLEGGAEEFLLKPVTPSDLEKLHSHLLKRNKPLNNEDQDSDQDDSDGDDDDDDDDDDDYNNEISEDISNITITVNHEINVVCNKEDKESDLPRSGINGTNKTKVIASTMTTASTLSSSQVQELPAS